ncbi:pilus assembly protein [Pseudomonas sp. CFII64]|uniref:pilus assembly protein n=1 Tax=Pseudomonas sp. CFII64 TaxID=911242 RepID=UPI0005D0F314|nr:PilC/PilY family type IV pilus protein [Pseudomonas sp. CFII64]
MVSAKALRLGLHYVYGALLALYVTAPVYGAFTPSPVPLLSASAVPPNLMLLVDNSGSMNNIIWASAFNPTVARPAITYVNDNAICGNDRSGYYYCRAAINIVGDDTLILNQADNNGCSSAYTYLKRNSVEYCLKLLDPVSVAGEGSTRYTADYLSYLIDLAVAAGTRTKEFTKNDIPNDFRMNVARTVSTNFVSNSVALVANNAAAGTSYIPLRIGLANFNAPVNADSGPGGKITKDVKDLSEVKKTTYQEAVSANVAAANVTDLKAKIAALRAEANTPLAETYYEVTRYFRGLKPFSTYSGAPTTYTSPIQYRCQKNFGVVITDGLPTYDRTFPLDDPDDVLNKGRSLPDWDLNAANDGANLNGDGEGDTLYLDDVAKFAYDIDMRRTVKGVGADLTLKSWDDAGFLQQNMSTYTIGFTAANQMLIDAADTDHGHGKYFQTNDSAGLTAALSTALSDIYAKAGSGGGGAANSATLTSGTRFYQTLYDPSDWHGTINAYDLNTTTGALSSAVWTTDDKVVSGGTPLFESWSTGTTPAKITLDFTKFAPAQQTTLTTGLPTGVTGINLIDWAKGTPNTKLRIRTKLIGDIVNSPLVAALPADKTSADLTGNATYSTYLTKKAASSGGMSYSLLVNANDGFFNVINADGTRRYAYMPSTALSSLAAIATIGYGSSAHKFTVDGQISVFDAQLGTSWRTIAFGGTGAGGKAYYGIKLYESDNVPVALWEVSPPASSDINNKFNNLGYAYSKPDVARMGDTAGTSIVVVGNGYGSFTGRASLFVLDANTGALIREIQTPIIKTGETDNGLSSVKLKVNSQNVVQAAYAGDLKGRLWKFDMSGATAASWKVAFNGLPLFTASDDGTKAITVQPTIIDHPTNGKIVYFGTGKFNEIADKTITAQQTFYAIWDADAGAGSITQSNLQEQTVSATPTVLNNNTYYTTSNNDLDWTAKKGWYMNLASSSPYPGERIIYPAQTSRGRIIFTTASVSSTDPCESTGTGRLFELDAVKGGMLNYQVLDTNGDNDITTSDTMVSGLAVFTGIPNLASIVAGTGGANDNKYLIDSSGNLATKLLEKGGTSNVYQRIMWRQIQ